jgi:hypothetical protein
LRWLDEFGSQLYLDDRLTGRFQKRALDFIRCEYIEKGAALFGRETSESLNDFRQTVDGALDTADDSEIYQILCFAVQRIRNAADILQMAQSVTITRLRIVSVIDEKTSPFCRLIDGKYISLAAAVAAVPKLLTPRKSYSLIDIRNAFDLDDILEDTFVLEGGIPPYHFECRTRLAAVIPGFDLAMSGAQQARYDEWRRQNPDSTYDEWRAEKDRLLRIQK